MSELVTRLMVAAVYLYAAYAILRVGEESTRWVRGFLGFALAASGIWWAAVAFGDPGRDAYYPWWAAALRVTQILIPIGVMAVAYRRREINGYH